MSAGLQDAVRETIRQQTTLTHICRGRAQPKVTLHENILKRWQLIVKMIVRRHEIIKTHRQKSDDGSFDVWGHDDNQMVYVMYIAVWSGRKRGSWRVVTMRRACALIEGASRKTKIGAHEQHSFFPRLNRLSSSARRCCLNRCHSRLTYRKTG